MYKLLYIFVSIVAEALPSVRPDVFGAGRKTTHVPTLEGIINTEDFFKKFISGQEAVLLKGLYTTSRAFNLWTDEYFLNLDSIPENHMVMVEHGKKENRTAPAEEMSFKRFVLIYHKTDQYMVEPSPTFLQ